MTTAPTKPETVEMAIQPAVALMPRSADLLMDPQTFEHVQRVAKVYASSNLVPQQYRGNIADCIIGLQMASRLGVDPFMFLQNTYVVGGRPGMEAKLAIALVNRRGPFRGPIQYKIERDAKGKAIACVAYATHKVTGEVCEARVDWDMVQAEGWSKRNGSKWLTMPEQMYCYRSAVFLARRYCPEVLVGMQTTDELADTYGDTRYVTATTTPATPASSMLDKIERQPEVEPEPATETAAEPTPTDDEPAGEPAPHEPSAVEQLCILYADLHDLAPADAEARLNAEAVKKWGKGLDALKPKALADLRDMVGNGMFKPE